MSDQQNPMSPKIAFFFGIVTAVAVVSLAGFVFLLSKQGGKGGSADTISGGGGETGSSAPESEDVSKTLSGLADKIGLDEDDFNSCALGGKYADKVNSDAADAQKAGGGGTPFTIIVGPNGPAMAVSGALPYEFFKTIIDTVLAGENAMEKVPPELQQYVADGKNLAYKPVDENDHVRGSVDAKIKLIEYSDFQCPFCKQHHPVMQKLVSAYSASDLSWTYRHLPLTSRHPLAQPLAEASECAAELGGNDGFWAFADAIFQ